MLNSCRLVYSVNLVWATGWVTGLPLTSQVRCSFDLETVSSTELVQQVWGRCGFAKLDPCRTLLRIYLSIGVDCTVQICGRYSLNA